jgi:phosphomethylpyrimidine kinase
VFFFYEKKEGIMKTALTIAGSDSSGGAGIQADIKAMTLNGVFAMSAITALTAQNTTGVTDIMDVKPNFLEAQMDAVFTDIYPDAVKIGMVSDKELIIIIADKLVEYNAKNIVIDPVMVATSGARLLKEDAIDTLKEKLLPLADLITPNIPEAEILSGLEIKCYKDMETAAEKVANELGVNVLLKGGHSINDSNDVLFEIDCLKKTWINGQRIDNENTHGTGCTLSSSIAANLAKGESIEESVRAAKKYLEGALRDGLDLGKGSGPMNHAFDIKEKYRN